VPISEQTLRLIYLRTFLEERRGAKLISPIKTCNPPRLILGVRVTPTTGWPWRAIAQISINNGAYICTGFFLGPHTVMTAAHCLYNSVELGGWATSVSVTPGMDGNTAPYGTQQASSWSVTNGWVLYETNGYDSGLITLPSDDLGNQVGWFTYQAATQAMVGSTANLSGYPGDKGATTQWEDSGQVKDLSAASISYDIYTYAGDSGAPVWLFDGTISRVIADHTQGWQSLVCYSIYNCGSPITSTTVTGLESAGVAAPNSTCYALTLLSSPGGAPVSVNPPSSGGCEDRVFSPSTSVSLVAYPVSGYTFSSWSGDCSGSNPTTSVSMGFSRSCTANYASNSTPSPSPTYSPTPTPTHSPTPTPSASPQWSASNFRWYENLIPPPNPSQCDLNKPVPPNIPLDAGLCATNDLQIPDGTYALEFVLRQDGVIVADQSFAGVHLYSASWSKSFDPPAPGGTYNLTILVNGISIGESTVVVPGPTQSPTPTPTHSPTPTPPHSPTLGDANCDNRIDGADVIAVLDHVGGIPNSAGCLGNADVDGDGHVTPFDALLILKYWAGLITTFPVSG
jgi:V8-like Glu-specific endopeptidase